MAPLGVIRGLMRVRTSGGGRPPRDDDRVPAELATPDPTTARETGRYRFGTKRSSGGPDAVLLLAGRMVLSRGMADFPRHLRYHSFDDSSASNCEAFVVCRHDPGTVARQEAP